VKTGGQVSQKGRRITLKVQDPEDLSRDILKVRIAQLTQLIVERDLFFEDSGVAI